MNKMLKTADINEILWIENRVKRELMKENFDDCDEKKAWTDKIARSLGKGQCAQTGKQTHALMTSSQRWHWEEKEKGKG